MNEQHCKRSGPPHAPASGAWQRWGLLLLVCGCGSSVAPAPNVKLVGAGRDAAVKDAASASTGAQGAGAVDAGADAAADAAVGGAASCDPGPSAGDFPCDVGAVIKARCQPCHQQPQKNGAHFPLLSYEDTRQPFGISGLLRFQRMAQVIEADGLPHMPPRTAAQPSDSELQTLRAWLASCALPVAEGSGCDTAEP